MDTKSEKESLIREIENFKKENDIISKQLEIKDRILNIILNNSTMTIAAFGPEGIMELNIGKGLDIPNVNTDPYKSAFIGYNLEQLEAIMPHVIKAIRESFEKNIITYAESISPSGKKFHVTLVPYCENDFVSYVYAISIRIPEASEVDEKHFYKGYLKLPPIENLK